MDCHSIYLESISKLCDPSYLLQTPLLLHYFKPLELYSNAECGALPFYENKKWHLEIITERKKNTFKMKLKIITGTQREEERAKLTHSFKPDVE